MVKWLPWWKDLYDPQERKNYPFSWTEAAWWPTYKSPEQLAERIEQYPLTPKIFLSFIKENVSQILLFPGSNTSIIASVSQDLKFEIRLGENSPEERGRGLAHESVHGIYRVSALPFFLHPEYRKIERLIEEEGQRFYSLNPSIVNHFVPS